MEVIQTTLIIYAALCLGFTVILTGGQNRDFVKYRFENVILFCDFPVNINLSNCQWYFTQNGGEKTSLTNGTRYTWSCSPSSANSAWVRIQISVKNVTFNDSGIYTCEAMAATGPDRQEIVLTVLGKNAKPEITVHKTTYTAVSGTNVTLECIVNANGENITSIEWVYEVNQQWMRAGISEKYFWTIQMPSLVISNVQTSDSRLYRCLAATRAGTAEGPDILLNVQIPVKIKELETRPVFISQGNTVQILCLVDGWPEPKVTWKLANGTTIMASTLKNVQENILILENVTNLNEGNYTCIAHNNFSRDESLLYLTVSDLPVFHPPNEDLTGSPLEKYVVPGVSVFVCVALIALIVVVILIRRKRQKGRTDKPNLEIRSTNGQEHPLPSENIRSGNNHSKFYVHLSGDMTYAQKIRKPNKIIDGNKSFRDSNIPQSDTHIDGNKSILDTDVSQVYMNINNAYAAVQQSSSTSNSNSCINEETESENTQVNKTEELNYVELEFSSNAQDENSSHGIRGSPSDTTYTEVVVFSR